MTNLTNAPAASTAGKTTAAATPARKRRENKFPENFLKEILIYRRRGHYVLDWCGADGIARWVFLREFDALRRREKIFEKFYKE